jgi:hypothetical protein
VTSSLALRSPIPRLGFRVKKIADELADIACVNRLRLVRGGRDW